MKAVFKPVGVMPACLMPLQRDGKIDEANYRRHLRDLANVKGLTGIVVNGHAAEVHALTLEQQIWGIATACEEVGNQIPIIAGVYAEATHFARDMANAAEKAGAQAILIFPPNSLMFGGNARPELGAQFVRDVAAATSLPAILFQFPLTTSLSYGFDSIVRLCDEVENIVAIKELGSEPRIHERTIEALHGLSKPVNVLTSQSQWLGASLSMGARGIISGAGSVIADRQRALFDAFVSESPNPKLQRELLAEMSLLVDVFYGAPYVNWQARMKQVLFHFKRFATPNVFAPLQTISQDDWQRIVALLDKAGLTADTLYRK